MADPQIQRPTGDDDQGKGLTWDEASHEFVLTDVVASPHGFAPGWWYGPQGTDGTLTMILNQLYLVEFEVDKTTTFDRIGCEVTTFATTGGIARLGVYPMVRGYPTVPLLDTTVTTTTNGIKPSNPISLTLTPGWYYTCGVAQVAACTVRSKTVQTNAFAAHAHDSTFNTNGSAWQIAGITGALPNNPIPATPAAVYLGSQAPKVLLRAA
jgi:hypothetical protein